MIIMARVTLKALITDRITGSTEAVFLRQDFDDLAGYDQVGRALRQLVSAGVLILIGYGLYAKAIQLPSGDPVLVDDPDIIRAAALGRLGVNTNDQGRFSRKINLSSDERPIHAIPGNETERLSQRLGLKFPYDWSNSRMKSGVLIDKVLEKSRFDDVLCISFYYGLPRIKQAAQRLHQGELPDRLACILNNIEIGFSDHKVVA